MKQFGIFQMKTEHRFSTKGVTFTAIKNPIKTKDLLLLEAESPEAAAIEAAELLQKLGVNISTKLGRQDTALHNFPNFFVAEIKTFEDDPATTFRIHNFTSV